MGGQKAIIEIDSLAVIAGGLSPRVLGLVTEWAAQRRDELAKNWDLALQRRPLEKITPLE